MFLDCLINPHLLILSKSKRGKTMQLILILLLVSLLNISSCVRETPYQAPRKIKRMSAEKFFEIKKAKLDKFVLPAMKNEGIDMWIVLTRE